MGIGIVVDIVIIVILALAILYGYKKGLVKVAVRLCTTIIAIVATLILYVPVSNLIINATGIDETIENAIYQNVSDAIKKEKDEKDKGNPVEELQGKIIEDAKNNVLQPTARKIAINVIRVGVIIILFIAIKFGLILVKALADAITKLPIIKQFNKVGGVVYGIIVGFTIIFALLEIAKIVSEINPQTPIDETIEQSIIGNTLYENNLIDIFLK